MPAAPIALFDLDGTLTRRDTLLPFLRYCVGTPRFLALLAGQVPGLLSLAAGLGANDLVKQQVLRAFFDGWPAARVEALGRAFAQEVLPGLLRGATMRFLHWHQAQGYDCYLVSASLDVYVAPWGLGQGFAGVLCSRLAADAEGRVDGRLEGKNVYGPEKVVRIREVLKHRLAAVEYAYGDSRGDLEMLALARHAWYGGRFQGAAPPGWLMP